MESVLKVITSDGEEFSIEREVLKFFITINTMLEVSNSLDDEPPVELQSVDSETFKIVLDWISHYMRDPPAYEFNEYDYRTDFQTAWEEEFFQDISQVTLHKLILASNYLDIQSLSIAAFRTVARLIAKAKTVEELRETFGIENDFSEDEAMEMDEQQNDETVEREDDENFEVHEIRDDYVHDNAVFYDEYDLVDLNELPREVVRTGEDEDESDDSEDYNSDEYTDSEDYEDYDDDYDDDDDIEGEDDDFDSGDESGDFTEDESDSDRDIAEENEGNHPNAEEFMQ